MIILTAAEAAIVRGPTGDGAGLDPVPLLDGAFALPARVLDDGRHGPFAARYLGALPVREVAPDEFPPRDGDA